MAVLTTYVSIDMLNPTIWYGALQSYSSTHITIAAGLHSGTYRGNFTYDVYGNVFGQLSSYETRYGGTLQGAVTGLNLDAFQLMNLVQSGNASGAYTYAFGGNDTLNGSAYGDKLRGFSGSDVIKGNGGNDRLYGDGGNDRLSGGAGADFLSGGVGADRMVGGSGADDLQGGTGSDTFVFERLSDSRGLSGRDEISDFTRGIDKIDLSLIDAKSGVTGNQAFSFVGSAAFSGAQGQLRYVNGHVYGDTNGDRASDFSIDLSNIPASLSASDFIL